LTFQCIKGKVSAFEQETPMRRLALAFLLLLSFFCASQSHADTVYGVNLHSLKGKYSVGTTASTATADWSIPTQNGTVGLESIALHYELQVIEFPTSQDGQGQDVLTDVDSSGSILFADLQAPGNSLGAQWGIPLEPGQFSYESQANSFEFIVQALSKNTFDIWVIDNLEQAYGTTPESDGSGTVELSFNFPSGQPFVDDGKVRVKFADALFSPDSVITPSSKITPSPEPTAVLLLGIGLLALGARSLTNKIRI
jgi:hypothetical protein